ncbi:UPF0223 family protein [Sediminibacillus halophilus]|uniref:UPF0223 protein SAMN05216244_0748 n=1 Tax=Sediminibacillus halophilus TaxID=482461 RepID=A0A1G9MW92_9BACI|nr:UPF0223 family protein [Sediminibacillus halophilus]SDL78393.1 Uncharacterized protein YktA, UPF0223 family [Sediminibacillus halophilus]
MNYSYPIEETWTKQEIIDVVNFYSLVEQAYESGVKRDDLMLAYTRFKQIVPSKSEEKQLCGKFEKESGYSCYRTVKKAKEVSTGEKIKM